MIKIGHYLSSGGFSGAEKIAIEIMKISEENFESYYISPQGYIEEILISEKITHINSSNTSLKEIVRRNNIDILYCHDFKATLKGALSLSKVKKISHIHQNPTWLRKFNIKSLLFLFSTFFMNEIVFVSAETRDQFIFKKMILNKSTVLDNYVDESEVTQKSKMFELDEQYDLIYLGRLEIVKNPILFIEIVKELKKKNKNIKAVMVGDGILYEEVLALIKKYGLESNIKVMGYQSNPYPYLKSSKISVIPSLWEGFGLSAVEAMILGVPVVASPVGGLTHVISSDSGYFANEIEEYIFAIEKLLKDPTLLNEKSIDAYNNSKRFTDANAWKYNVNRLFSDVVEKGL